ncbi:MAG: ATPase V [Treponema sp.]|jgi:V/A-type H+-transporting ATPase subunit F|nr:ATPase V [Treponema sp.]
MDYFFLGDSELVTAFRFVGVRGAGVSGPAEALGAFRKLTQNWDATAETVLPGTGLDDLSGGCRVLIVTEEVADWLGKALTDWQLQGRYPLVVEIPGLPGRLPGRKTLVDSIREAVGIHV